MFKQESEMFNQAPGKYEIFVATAFRFPDDIEIRRTLHPKNHCALESTLGRAVKALLLYHFSNVGVIQSVKVRKSTRLNIFHSFV